MQNWKNGAVGPSNLGRNINLPTTLHFESVSGEFADDTIYEEPMGFEELARDAAQSALALVDSGLNCEHGDLAMCPRFQSVLAERVDSRSAAGDVAGD